MDVVFIIELGPQEKIDGKPTGHAGLVANGGTPTARPGVTNEGCVTAAPVKGNAGGCMGRFPVRAGQFFCGARGHTRLGARGKTVDALGRFVVAGTGKTGIEGNDPVSGGRAARAAKAFAAATSKRRRFAAGVSGSSSRSIFCVVSVDAGGVIVGGSWVGCKCRR